MEVIFVFLLSRKYASNGTICFDILFSSIPSFIFLLCSEDSYLVIECLLLMSLDTLLLDAYIGRLLQLLYTYEAKKPSKNIEGFLLYLKIYSKLLISFCRFYDVLLLQVIHLGFLILILLIQY